MKYSVQLYLTSIVLNVSVNYYNVKIPTVPVPNVGGEEARQAVLFGYFFCVPHCTRANKMISGSDSEIQCPISAVSDCLTDTNFSSEQCVRQIVR